MALRFISIRAPNVVHLDLDLLCEPNGEEEWLLDLYLLCAPNDEEE